MSAPERPAPYAGRAAQKKKEREWNGGVSDPALALFGPLRAGSLTPLCQPSVVLQEAARTRAEIVAGFVTQFRT